MQSSTASAAAAEKLDGRKGKAKVESSSASSSSKTSPTSDPSGSFTTVAEYFLKKYQINTDPTLPVVNVGTGGKPSYLPAEACVIAPGQVSQAKSSPEQTDRMMRFAIRPPYANATSIGQYSPGILGLLPGQQPHLTVDTRMITVPGRVLGFPTIKYRGGEDDPRAKMYPTASWNMENVHRAPLKFSDGASLRSWHILIVELGDPNRGKSLTDNLDKLGKALHHAGD